MGALRTVCAALVAVAVAMSLAHATQVTNIDVVVHDLSLFVEGKEYWVKGMAYNPAPLGIKYMHNDRFGGAGLCSPRRSPWNEWVSACWDSDFFDAAPADPNLDPHADQWFLELWERDFPLMRSLGVNTLRIYNVNPTTRQATEDLLDQQWNHITLPLGKEHRTFLDLAYANGFRVMFPLVSDEAMLSLTEGPKLVQMMKNLIDEVGNHRAVIGWIIGNELDLHRRGKEELLSRVNELARFTRDYTLARWKRTLPVTSCVTDYPESYEFLAKALDMDLFCANAGYRGAQYNDLWTPNDRVAEASRFRGWAKLSQETGMPLLIGEFGWPTVDNAIHRMIPDWFNQAYSQIVRHKKDGCIGVFYFEYSDEPYKDAMKDQQQLGLVELLPYVDPVTGKSSAASVGFLKADLVVPKPIIFEAVRSGKPINFRTNIWEYLGVQQTAIQVVEHNNQWPEKPKPKPPATVSDTTETSIDIPPNGLYNPDIFNFEQNEVVVLQAWGGRREIWRAARAWGLMSALFFVWVVST